MLNLWNTLLYEPFVNILAFLVSVIPGGDVGVAVIVFTLVVKLALSPISKKSIKSQSKLNKLNPELKKIKESGKSKEEQAQMTFALYKEHGVNPFSGCLFTLLQIPIIFALYYVFMKGLSFDSDIIYSFITAPVEVNMYFLGVLDIGGKSLLLAILAGVSQFFQARFMPKPQKVEKVPGKTPSFQESLTNTMQIQMRYVFPFLIAFIAYNVSGAVALYWIVNNIFTATQNFLIKNKS